METLRPGLIERPDHPLSQFRGDEVMKRYWSIGEVSEMYGVAASAIRFYLGEFQIQIKRSRKGNRQFNADEVKFLRVIVDLCFWLKIEKVKDYVKRGCAEQVLRDLEKYEMEVVNGS